MTAEANTHTLRCSACDLTIERDGAGYRHKKPGLVAPTKLNDFETLKQAYLTGRCPLCGFEMTKQEKR